MTTINSKKKKKMLNSYASIQQTTIQPFKKKMMQTLHRPGNMVTKIFKEQTCKTVRIR